jgi:hypothetical protein
MYIENIEKAVDVLNEQLLDKDAHFNNYRLLNKIEEYLQNCEDVDLNDIEEKKEQIRIYLEIDLNWDKHFFPISL